MSGPYECPSWPKCDHPCLRDGQVIVGYDRLVLLKEIAAAAREVMTHVEHEECDARWCVDLLARLDEWEAQR